VVPQAAPSVPLDISLHPRQSLAASVVLDDISQPLESPHASHAALAPNHPPSVPSVSAPSVMWVDTVLQPMRSAVPALLANISPNLANHLVCPVVLALSQHQTAKSVLARYVV
jgi:hypothetical protein